MALEKLTLASLATMDGGRHAAAFEQALTRARFDCEDRAAVKGARRIALVVSLIPRADDNGNLERVHVEFALDEKHPKRQSRSYSMQAVHGGLVFNELSPDDVRQGTLDMAGKPKPAPAPAPQAPSQQPPAASGTTGG